MSAVPKDDIHPVPFLDLEHHRVTRFLETIREGPVPSLLFTGPEGAGKEYTAIEFARRLCCTAATPCEPGGTVCDSCATAVLLEHPGIHLIYPTPTQGSGETEEGDVTDTAKILEEKRLDVFSTYHFAKKVSIRIARSRAVIQRANTKPFGSKYNVFVFVDAHAMREEAQNALLKVVEEPPPHAAIVFVTHNPEGILYTIRSRCQQVRFTPLKTAVVERILGQYYDVSPRDAHRAAALAQGNIRRARTLLESFDDSDRNTAAAFVEQLGEAPESWVIGQALAVGRGSNRESVARYLHELSLIFRDVMAEDKDLLVNNEMAELIGTLAARWERSRLPGVIGRIGRARHEILIRNANIDAALVDLFLDIKRAQ